MSSTSLGSRQFTEALLGEKVIDQRGLHDLLHSGYPDLTLLTTLLPRPVGRFESVKDSTDQRR